MKSFFLSEILIYSAKERKARRVSFHPSLTVILGKNDTGKSVLIKSIYHTFGAEVKFDSKWAQASTCSLVKFSVDHDQYSILRFGKIYGLFDKDNNLIGSYDSVTTGLGPVLAELFDFKMLWNNREGETCILPPAYFLLPYYIDQDKSWSDNWNSFEHLQQFGGWRTALVEYHTGLKPNEYYIAKTEYDQLKEIANEKNNENKLMKNLLKNTEKTITEIDFNTNITSFSVEVENLIKTSSDLQNSQIKHKNNLNNLYSQKINLENQQKVVLAVLNDIKKDLLYATDELDENIECPTCGAHYSNSFKERFAIAEDEHKCFELNLSIHEALKEVSKKTENERKKLNDIVSEIENIQSILSIKKKELVLRDLIENEGKKRVQTIFIERIEELAAEYYTMLESLSVLDMKIKSYLDKGRREQIVSYYKRMMHVYLKELNVSLFEDDYNKIESKIGGLGSAKPRGLLAYYFSILNVIKRFGSSAYCPIIIDEPDQQGQDDLNMPAILSFIINFRPKDSQLVLGLQDTIGFDFEGSTVVIDNKFSVLNAEDFESVQLEITPLIGKVISINNDIFGE